MATPSEKSPEMTAMLDNLSKQMFGRERTSSIESGICVTCGKPAKDFRDPPSEREFSISGMCQECQDLMFGV